MVVTSKYCEGQKPGTEFPLQRGMSWIYSQPRGGVNLETTGIGGETECRKGTGAGVTLLEIRKGLPRRGRLHRNLGSWPSGGACPTRCLQ